MNIEQWQHHHSFGENKEHIEKKTLMVVILTFIMMIAEIAFGLMTNSMALFADGLHMGTHTFALGVSLLAYILARKHSKNKKFAFGTWKIEILGAYTSALTLGIVAVLMLYSSIERIIHPVSIYYNQALIVAIIGLVVNLISAVILNLGRNTRNLSVNDGDDHHNKHEDLNLKSAYLHVIADALTSIFAIIALLSAKYLNFNYLDPIMGIIGAILITRWAFALLRDSSKILLDYDTNMVLSDKIRKIIEDDRLTLVTDLHLWKVSDNSYSCIIALVSKDNLPIVEYKSRLSSLSELAHITIEINKIK